MTITRAVARPLLSSIFVVGGADAVRHPDTKVKKADPVASAIAQKVPGLPDDTEFLVKLNGAVMVVAGSFLALGKFPRLAALALIGTIVPTTYAGHRFWEETDDATRAQQRVHFLKNLGLLGGLILAAVDTEGAPSLSWRARRKAERVGRAVAIPTRLAGQIAHDAAQRAASGIDEVLS
jgi:putative oxidoreductase